MTATLPKLAADFETQLALPVSAGDTTATLASVTDDDGNALANGLYALTIDNGTSSKEYIVCTLTGTALTAITTVTRQGVASSGFARAHRRGAQVAITDWVAIKRINNVLDGTTNFNSAVNLGYDGAPTSLTGNQFATVQYVLDTVSGGTVTFDQQIIPNQTAGETLAINDVVYFKESDQRWWKADADDSATFYQVKLGINKSVAIAGGTIQVAISGPVSGFTGLTAGSKYYLSNTAGAISTSAGTTRVFIGWALSTTILVFSPYEYNLPSADEKAAMAGGGDFGTPSSTNKFVTEDGLSSETTAPTVQTFVGNSTLGTSTTQFDITNTAGTTYRYTYDGTGDDPGISAITFPVGTVVDVQCANFDAANNGLFVVTGSGANYFEVTNASGVAESNKTIGAGYLTKGTTYTKPAGLKYIVVEVQAGGGGGAYSANAGEGVGGGGAGAYAKKVILASALSATENIIAGSGGRGTDATHTAGNGGRSVFKSIIAGGGTASATAASGNQGTGGTATGGDVNIPGGDGTRAMAQTGSGSNYATGGQGGASFMSGSVVAGNGKLYGGGAGGGLASSGYVGASGIIIVTEYYA